jgi:hypothetical protein
MRLCMSRVVPAGDHLGLLLLIRRRQDDIPLPIRNVRYAPEHADWRLALTHWA